MVPRQPDTLERKLLSSSHFGKSARTSWAENLLHRSGTASFIINKLPFLPLADIFHDFLVIMSDCIDYSLPCYVLSLRIPCPVSVPLSLPGAVCRGGAGTETPLWEGYVYRDSATGAPLAGPSGTEAPDRFR